MFHTIYIQDNPNKELHQTPYKKYLVTYTEQCFVRILYLDCDRARKEQKGSKKVEENNAMYSTGHELGRTATMRQYLLRIHKIWT